VGDHRRRAFASRYRLKEHIDCGGARTDLAQASIAVGWTRPRARRRSIRGKWPRTAPGRTARNAERDRIGSLRIVRQTQQIIDQRVDLDVYEGRKYFLR